MSSSTIVSVLVIISVLDTWHVSAFTVTNCMPDQQNNSDNILSIIDAHINPSDIVAPGNLLVRVNLDILRNVTSDLDLSVVIKKKVWRFWITIHRRTHSLCGVLDREFLEVDGTNDCPNQLVDAGLPCRCPFTQGRYSLPESSFYINQPIYFAYGQYWTQALLRDPNTGALKACYVMELNLSRP
ncbi:ganglioside GM2 activator-like [Pecten maximus]|uniref:ganglioside GM2 activator-like n=1 Tax=Pecten maximus TaxID=6579 RepID=UPI0014583229|nr:ganglioside GM2 activator-like [Pecten maximus]